MIDYTSVQTQLERIQSKVAETYDIAEGKGAEIPVTKNIDNLPATVASITGGGEPNFFPINLQQNDTEIIIDTELEPNAFLGVMKNGNYKFYITQEVTE